MHVPAQPHGTRRFFLACALLLVSACGSEPKVRPLQVAAAVSTTEVLTTVVAAWRKKGGGPVTLRFDATSRIAKQIIAGSPDDVFLSADEAWMNEVAKHKKVRQDVRTPLLGNRLVLAVGATERVAPSTPPELRALTGRIAVAGSEVPAGRYADASLRALGLWEHLEPRIVRAAHVRDALRWVATGEARAAIVYRTDVVAERRVRVAFAFPRTSYPPILYSMAALARADATAREKAEAVDFVHFCTSSEAIEIYRRHAFEPPPAPPPARPGAQPPASPGAPPSAPPSGAAAPAPAAPQAPAEP